MTKDTLAHKLKMANKIIDRKQNPKRRERAMRAYYKELEKNVPPAE